MLILWERIHSRCIQSELAFPGFDGDTIHHLERKIDAAAKPLGHSLPTATEFRKDLEMKNKRLPGHMREAVSHSLSHSRGTAAQYYQASTSSDSYSTYTNISRLIDGEVGNSPSPTPPPHDDMDAEQSPSPPPPRVTFRSSRKGKGRVRVEYTDDEDETQPQPMDTSTLIKGQVLP